MSQLFVYDTHLCITCNSDFRQQNSGKNSDFLEFLAAKFELHLTFVQLFNGSYRVKIRIAMVLKYKIYTEFRINYLRKKKIKIMKKNTF